MRIALVMCILLTGCSRPAVTDPQSPIQMNANESVLDFGSPALGATISMVPEGAVETSCGGQAPLVDCEYAINGIHYLVFEQTLTRKCVRRSDGAQAQWPLGLDGRETPDEARLLVSELTQTPMSLESVDGNLVVANELSLTNTMHAEFEFYLRYSIGGQLIEACARGVSP